MRSTRTSKITKGILVLAISALPLIAQAQPGSFGGGSGLSPGATLSRWPIDGASPAEDAGAVKARPGRVNWGISRRSREFPPILYALLTNSGHVANDAS